MIKDFYSKLVGTALAFSILFLGLYNHYFDLADSIRTVTIFLLVVGFVIGSLKTKGVRQVAFLISLVLWIILLINPTDITDHLAFLEQEKQLKKLALLVQYDNDYQKMSIYTKNNENELNTSYNYNQFDFQLIQPIHQLENSSKLNQIKSLLKATNLIGFQLGHDCITFYLTKKKILRYYYTQRNPYTGDHKIKANWYWVKHSFYEQ